MRNLLESRINLIKRQRLGDAVKEIAVDEIVGPQNGRTEQVRIKLYH